MSSWNLSWLDFYVFDDLRGLFWTHEPGCHESAFESGDRFRARVDHAVCYAKENVHTNGLENFWSLLKRSIRGTYVSVEPFHLFRYLDEQAFRFNHRKQTDSERFQLAASGIFGQRLTYQKLTRLSLEGFWAQLKRSIDGTHHHVSPKYLQAYVDEFSFRYSNRYAGIDETVSMFELMAERTGAQLSEAA